MYCKELKFICIKFDDCDDRNCKYCCDKNN